jgi:hypothetical protein
MANVAGGHPERAAGRGIATPAPMPGKDQRWDEGASAVDGTEAALDWRRPGLIRVASCTQAWAHGAALRRRTRDEMPRWR